MKRTKTLATIATIATLATLSFSAWGQAKNTIYFIGDGMGPSILTAARLYKGGAKEKLHWESFPVVGMARTYSSSDFVTDSAASATALASGVKTYNKAIGMSDPLLARDKESKELQTIFDIAIAKGKSVGIITTTRVTHATPACFYAHAKFRSQEKFIASQAPSSKIEFILGGGAKFFNDKILKDAEAKGWKYIQKKSDLLSYNGKDKVLGLFNNDHLTYLIDRDQEQKEIQPELDEMVEWGISRLAKNPNGYILMVESGRIDHAAHKSYVKRALGETLQLETAVKKADMMTSDDDTLIVITSDHDTGGLSLNGYAPGKSVKGDNLLGNEGRDGHSLLTWGTGPGGKSPEQVPENHDHDFQHKAAHYQKIASHTAVDVLVMAKGAGSENFGGFMNNNQIPKKILKAMKLPKLKNRK